MKKMNRRWKTRNKGRRKRKKKEETETTSGPESLKILQNYVLYRKCFLTQT